jgi:hypothetical protein
MGNCAINCYAWRLAEESAMLLRALAFGAILCLAGALGDLSPSAVGQAPTKPSPTSPASVSLEGTWSSRGLTTTERVAPGPLVLDDAAANALAAAIRGRSLSPVMAVQIDPDLVAADVRTLNRVKGAWRSSQIIDPPDGKLPLSDVAKKLLTDADVEMFGPSSEGPEVRPAFERCLGGTGLTPLHAVPSNNMRTIVQTSTHLVIYTEEGGDVRILDFSGSASSIPGISQEGRSAARWEGGTLVVETTGVRPVARSFPWGRLVLSGKTRIREEFRLASPDELLYRFTVDDPDLYTRPFTSETSFHRSTERVFEFGCHAGNYSLTNILTAARLYDARAEGMTGKPKRRRP